MKKKNTLLGNLVFLLQNMKTHAPRSFLLVLICIPLRVLLPFIGILLPNIVVSAITEQGDLGRLILVVAVLGSVTVAASFLDQWGMGIIESEAGIFSDSLMNRLYYKKLDCDYENLENKEISGRFSEAQSYIWNGRRYIRMTGTNLNMMGSGVFGFLVYLAVLRHLPVWLLCLMVVATVVNFLFSDMGQKQRMKREYFLGEGVRKIGYLQRISSDPKAGKDIRLYRMIPWMEQKFTQLHKEIREDYISIEKKNFLSGVIAVCMGVLIDGSAYVYLTKAVMAGGITLADYVLYIGAVLGFTGWIRQVAEQVQKLWMMKGDVDAVRECLDMPDRSEILREAKETVSTAAFKQSPCEITFDHVTYRYAGSDKDTIRDLSFHIKKGERVALVGMNGAGKTTCVKLLCGLLEPTKGRICINGVDSLAFDRKAYYGLFSTVFQEINLFPASVRENITGMPKGEEDEKRMEHCLILADLKERVDAMPQKADTMLVKELDEKALNLSGGEQQRLFLARALYKNAPVLILDEPTAALDPVSESNVYQKYFTLTQNRTSVFISHRLASTRFCDRILFLEDGKIVESGTHAQLMELGQKYAQTFAIQSRYYKEDVGEEVSFA